MNLFKNFSKLLKLNRNFKTEDKIRREIENLERDGIDWQSVLNQEAISLLIAFLAVWSIPVSPLASHRLFVSTLILAIFSATIEAKSKQSNRTESFPKIIIKIEEKIRASNLNEKSKKSLFYDLNNAKAKIVGKSARKNTWIFTICWCYCMIQYWFFADTVLVSIRNRLIQHLQ